MSLEKVEQIENDTNPIIRSTFLCFMITLRSLINVQSLITVQGTVVENH